MTEEFLKDLFFGLPVTGTKTTLNVPKGYPVDIIKVVDDANIAVSFEIAVALAGVAKEQVGINVKDTILTISVEKAEDPVDEKRKYAYNGISRRAWKYELDIKGMDVANINAAFADGLLKIVLPVAEEAKAKTISIA